MPFLKSKFFLIPGLVILMVAELLLVWPTTHTNAQCGSQASSCKNCHEVQGQKSVNSDGTGWHKGHAFGDFCYLCHAGNNQATDQAAAHMGMVSPLSDVKAACQSCHAQDYTDRAKVYAVKLGVEVGGGAPTAGNATPPPPKDSPAEGSKVVAQQDQAVLSSSAVVDQQSLVNYVQRYNENIPGKQPANWGNIILIVMIGGMVIGGGSLVLHREGLVKVSFKELKPVEGEFPSDVVDMLPEITRLKPAARKSLHHLLAKSEATAEFLISIDKLIEDDLSDKQK